MDKLYFEMTDAERTFTHLIENIDYAMTIIAEGVVSTYKSLSREEVLDLQSEISDHLIDASRLLGKLLEDTEKLDDDIDSLEDCKETVSLKMETVTLSELNKIMRDSTIYNSASLYDEDGKMIGSSIIFRHGEVEELSKFRTASLCYDGTIRVSEEY